MFSKASPSFVSDETISSSAVNANFDDLANDANTPRPIAAGGTGGASATAAWDNIAKGGADVASASALDLTAVTGPIANLTGTAPVSTVTLAVGSIRFLRATGAVPLVASVAFVINGSQTTPYTCNVGDLLFFEGTPLGCSVWVIGTGYLAGIVAQAVAYPALMVSVSGGFFFDPGTHQGRMVRFDATTDGEINLPQTAAAGTSFSVAQVGAGKAHFVREDGGDLLNVDSYTRTAGPGAIVSLIVLSNSDGASAEWTLAGATAP